MSNMRELISSFSSLHVLVIGDAMLDVYLEGRASRLCREAPVPVVDLEERRCFPGGAANTAVNARELGASVSLLAAVGEDAEGETLRQELQLRGVDVSPLLRLPHRRTITKQRVVAASQILLRLDEGTTSPLPAEAEEEAIGRLESLLPRCDAIIVSDYAYGVLTPALLGALARLQARYPRAMVVDARDLLRYREVGVTAVKPNFQEALRLLGGVEPSAVDRAGLVLSHGERLLGLTGAQIVAVTLDRDGAVVLERGRPPYRTYAARGDAPNCSGAGDTFAAALALALAAGAQTPVAAETAAAASAVAVAKRGTSACSLEELWAQISQEGARILDLTALLPRLEEHRRRGERIVFTNGCFDILHRGHIAVLTRGKMLGDVLVVGLNSDGSVARLKGAGRPINSLEYRAQVLAALSCVDYIVPFEEETPAGLLRAIRPDVYVKGGDYTRDALPEAELVQEMGGIVEIAPYVDDHSTTGIIQRAQRAGALEGH